MRWVILQTPRALELAEQLDLAGFRVWTPKQTIRKRLPRSRKRIRETRALVPGFVFAESRQAFELVAVERTAPEGGLPPFKVMRQNSQIPTIADSELDGLRFEESKRLKQSAKPQAKPPEFDIGEVVNLPGAGFEGMSGRVIETKGRYTLLEVKGFTDGLRVDSVALAGKNKGD